MACLHAECCFCVIALKNFVQCAGPVKCIIHSSSIINMLSSLICRKYLSLDFKQTFNQSTKTNTVIDKQNNSALLFKLGNRMSKKLGIIDLFFARSKAYLRIDISIRIKTTKITIILMPYFITNHEFVQCSFYRGLIG